MKIFSLTETLSRVESLASFKAQISADLPEYVFHYTNPQGLLGIVSSGTLWMSDSSFLNDPSELVYFKEIVQNCCHNICNSKSNQNTSMNYKDFIEKLGNFAPSQVGSVFLASLSEHRDQLSQWRAYAGGGPGYALGFRSSELAKSISSSDILIGKCNYSSEGAHNAAYEIIRAFEREFFAEDRPTLDIQSICYEFSRVISFVAPLFKHKAFKEEAEWRVFCYSHWQDPRLNYRATATQIIPYMPLEIKSLATRIGLQTPNFLLIPGPGLQYSATAGQGIFFRYLNSNVSVSASEAPYVFR